MNSDNGVLETARPPERLAPATVLSPLPPLVERGGAPAAAVLLALSAVIFVVSMPLAWHHDVIPAAGYRVVRGIDGASWLIVAAAICVGFIVRFARRPPEFLSRWLITIATFLVVLGMFIDYINWQDNAGVLYVRAYFGPGFFVALSGALVLVLATVAVWRSAR